MLETLTIGQDCSRGSRPWSDSVGSGVSWGLLRLPAALSHGRREPGAGCEPPLAKARVHIHVPPIGWAPSHNGYYLASETAKTKDIEDPHSHPRGHWKMPNPHQGIWSRWEAPTPYPEESLSTSMPLRPLPTCHQLTRASIPSRGGRMEGQSHGLRVCRAWRPLD